MTASDRWRSGAVVALLVVFVAVTFGPALVGHGMLLDTGWLHAMMPYAASGPIPDGTLWCRGDTWDYYLPGVENIVEGARHGSWQTWAPYEVGGAPLASLPNHAVLSPVSWPYWVMPMWLAPAWAKLTELVLVLAGMTLFLGRLGVRRSIALVAGLVFFTSGFMMMWTNWPHTKVACLVPLLLWALDRAVRERGARDLAAVGLVVAAMLLGGFPAVTMFALTLGGIYVVVRALALRDVRRTLTAGAIAAGGVGLGVALSAVQVLPFALNMSALGLDERVPNEVKPASLVLTTVAPNAYGTCASGLWAGEDNPIESIAFVGVAALVLVLCALVVRLPGGRRPATPALLAVVLAAVVWLLWIGGLPLDLLQKLPGYSSNSFGRANSIFGFLCAALAGIGLERLLQRAEHAEAHRTEAGHTEDESDAPEGDWSWRPRQVMSLVVVVVAAVAAAYFLHAAYAFISDAPRPIPDVAAKLRVPALLLVVSALAVATTLLLRGRLRLLGPLVLVLAVLAQSTTFAREVLPLTDRSDFYPVTPAHKFLKKHLGEERYGASSWEHSAVADHYRLRTPTGHEFTTPEWKSLIAAVNPDAQLSPTYSDFPANIPTPGRQPVLDQLSVRYWVTQPLEVIGAVERPQVPASRREGLRVEPGEKASCQVPRGNLRGVEVTVPDGLKPRTQEPAVVRVSVGTGADTITSERAVTRPLKPGERLRVAVPDHRFTSGPVPVTITVDGKRKPVQLAGRTDGSAVCSAVRPEKGDGLRVVHASAGAVVYERASALPRIRWAGTSEVVADGPTRVQRLRDGVAPGTVLLDDDSTPAVSGSTAQVDVRRDEPESISAEVTARGSGYLVVADSIARPGWSATVDGREVPIVPGNHAFAAVPVPDGAHTVTLTYDAPGLRTGAWVSLLGALVTLGLLIAPRVLSRVRRGRAT
ncbi:YfhO family protein [Nocardioides albertanoniae]|uniref:YfhO family protein n=1 Tax=Nocardioides albertanoniae TaxID=1175486 RepID=UPI00114E3BAF|nr:YfhO family protein [Nocardioides albertanoniae]